MALICDGVASGDGVDGWTWRGAALRSRLEVGTDPLRDLPAFSPPAGTTCATQMAWSAGRPKSVVKMDGKRPACCARSWRTFYR